MDQRIFDQLDMLEQGGPAKTRRRRGVYDNSSPDYSAHDNSMPEYDEQTNYSQTYQPMQDEFVDQPVVLDSFDEQLLQQPDHTSRHGQASLGRARLSLPPGTTQAPLRDSRFDAPVSPIHPRHAGLQKSDLSRYTFDSGHRDLCSSSPSIQRLPSSPAFNASQRRPGPADYDRPTLPSACESLAADSVQLSGHHALNVETPEAGECTTQSSRMEAVKASWPEYADAQPVSKTNHTKGGPPVVQGINLVSTYALPDRFRAIFPYPLFNAVQSKSFDTIYKTNDNFVLSAPTGSGKTAVLELAICRLINGFTNGTYKIVYQAPTKSLCSERQRDWQVKFAPLDLQCAELTGDTDNALLRNVQHASIIITTPEKWDSMTRKWRDHQKLMQMVKLFLIDEVHILKEDRGATLEAVVSRMKSIGSDVRFVALSATVPNSQDISVWLGKNPTNEGSPATREKFGEEFRPVRLQKHVCGYQSSSNDFAFEKTLNAKLPDVIAKWSQRKPLMIFCFTRSACVETAKLLANWWTSNGPRERYWGSPRKNIIVADKDLRDTVSSGVAFHHAGLSIQDRTSVEKGYVEGDIQVICSTSTLAVGINLPCHMVVIKNTVTYHNNSAGGCKEYSDLEVMQMLGRAGRPQFDNSAVAVIMTRLHRVPYYEKMVTGQDILESCLHRNLIDHLNAEIGLGTITSPSSATKWLMGTFLFVRLKENPDHYRIEGDTPGRTLDERLEHICKKGLALLEEHDLIRTSPKLQCTEFGDAMARYCLQYDTMKIFMSLAEKARLSEILSAIAQAAEFREIRFRAGEKNTYKALNKNGSIKFPINVNLDAPSHKVSLVIQSVLGAVELPTEDHRQRIEYNNAKAVIFQHAHRLVRCIVDCQLHLEDAVATRNALMLARSLGAQVWDDSPLHMKQLESVGLVYVRKLVAAGIVSIEDLEITEAHRIETTLSRNPPYGAQLQGKAKAFPRLRVSVKMMGEPVIKNGECVRVDLKAEIGFLNEKVPEVFQRKPVYVCLLAETSDGKKVHFARISAKKLNKGQDVFFSANLKNATQSIRAYVMCDEIAGTMRHAKLKPDIPSSAFPPPKSAEETNRQKGVVAHAPNSAKRRVSGSHDRFTVDTTSDEFGDEDIDDADLTRAEAEAFIDIDEFDESGNQIRQSKEKKRKTNNEVQTQESNAAQTNDNWQPQQLANGKWACNHACKDKTQCRHLCCREGVDKKPKAPKPKENRKQPDPGSHPKQTQLSMSVSKTPNEVSQDVPSRKSDSASAPRKANRSREASELNRLHNSIKTETRKVPSIGQNQSKNQIACSSARGGQPHLSFLDATQSVEKEASSDYGMDAWDSNDLPEMSGYHPRSRMSPPAGMSDRNDVDEEMLDILDHGDEGSQHSLSFFDTDGDGHVDMSSYAENDIAGNDESFPVEDSFDNTFGKQMPTMLHHLKATGDIVTEKGQNLFIRDSSDPTVHDPGRKSEGKYRKRTLEEIDPNCKSFPAAKETKIVTRTPSAQIREEADRLERVLPANDFLAGVAEAAAAAEQQEETSGEKPASPDETRKLFDELFGEDLFNYTG